MKNRKIYWYIFIISLSSVFTACTSPVGDFGRLNSNQLSQITQPQLQTIGNSTYRNPLEYSQTEKKFRLTAHLLKQIPYKINIVDTLKIINKVKFPPETAPINGQALLNSFKAAGINNISERYQSLSIDLENRIINMSEFHELAQKTIAEDLKRKFQNNATYKAAVENRRQQNIAQIRDIVFYMKKLHISYSFVATQGKAVEPNININPIKQSLSSFLSQINRLEKLL